MAARSFLDRKRTSVAFLVNGDVMEEGIVGFREIFSGKRPSGFLSSQPALDGCQDHPHGGLRSQDFEEVGVRNQ